MIIHAHNSTKRKSRKPNAQQRQLVTEWDEIVKKYEPKRAVKYKAVTWQPTKSYVRETPHIPSLNTSGGTATKAPSKVYTGSKVLGIATLHKSNAVPVFNNQEAVDISSMRR